MDWLCLPGQDAPDTTWIGRFETLTEDAHALADKLGVAITLPHLRKPRKRADPVAWSTEMKEIVREIYARDYRTLGYS